MSAAAPRVVVAGPAPTEAEAEPAVESPPPRTMSTLAMLASLSKARLGALVVASTMAGFFVTAPVTSATVLPFLATSFGTGLAVASANALNQIFEVAHDSRMRRTGQRVLVSGALSMGAACTFAAACGVLGPLVIALGGSELAASLALGNIALYALVYTPLKRRTVANTWIGSVVGAVPPLIGWVGAVSALHGEQAAVASLADPSAWILPALLFVWQLPHFHALSWPLAADYRAGGYRMLCVEHPERVAPTCVRWSYIQALIGPAAYATGLASLPFLVLSLVPAAYQIWTAHQFAAAQTHANSRRLFFATLRYLPVVMILLLLCSRRNADDDEPAAAAAAAAA